MGVKAIGRTAFDAVYEENAQIVYKTALYYSGNCDTAEEITQAVFMKLYVSMENINMEAVDNWLVVTAKHMAINIGRKGRREVLRENVTETGETDPASVSPEEEFISRLRKREYRELAETIFTELFRGAANVWPDHSGWSSLYAPVRPPEPRLLPPRRAFSDP